MGTTAMIDSGRVEGTVKRNTTCVQFGPSPSYTGRSFLEVRTLRIEANREGEVLYTDLNLFWCLQKRSRDWIYTNNFEEFIHERS